MHGGLACEEASRSSDVSLLKKPMIPSPTCENPALRDNIGALIVGLGLGFRV